MNEAERNRIVTVIAAWLDGDASIDLCLDADLIPRKARIDGEHVVVTMESFDFTEQIEVRLAIVDHRSVV